MKKKQKKKKKKFKTETRRTHVKSNSTTKSSLKPINIAFNKCCKRKYSSVILCDRGGNGTFWRSLFGVADTLTGIFRQRGD